ncbi:MAG: hypothetical protein ACLTR4_15980 [Gallintestinimicrobium sp.]
MEQVKPRLLLVVPMLHQGGFERVCVRTARILRNDFEVTIAMFSDADIAYDINGLSVVNLDVPAQDGKLKKMVNVVKRTVKLRKLKKKLRPDLTYSFGPTANLINVLTPVRGQIWTGIRSYMDMDNPSKLKLFAKRSDQVICCSEVIAHDVKGKTWNRKYRGIVQSLRWQSDRRKCSKKTCGHARFYRKKGDRQHGA